MEFTLALSLQCLLSSLSFVQSGGLPPAFGSTAVGGKRLITCMQCGLKFSCRLVGWMRLCTFVCSLYACRLGRRTATALALALGGTGAWSLEVESACATWRAIDSFVGLDVLEESLLLLSEV